MAKVIITDDANVIRDMLGEMLEDLGHTVLGAGSGEELLEVYEREKPAIVFLDIIMEDNGLEVLDRLKEIDANVRVVICSAIAGMPYVMDEAGKKGVVACIRKPFTVEQVSEAIEKCLETE